MNKKIYKTFILFLIGSFGLIAQSEKKYQKTFSVDKNTQLLFQTQNIDVTFKTWNKNEVKVDFTVDFQNYSNEEIKKISEAIIISARASSLYAFVYTLNNEFLINLIDSNAIASA